MKPQTPTFSVIMPSFLGKYKHAAANRDEKLVRAIESVLGQEDCELVVVADGCQQTVDIVKSRFANTHGIRLFWLPERKIKGKRGAGSSGVVRNAGLGVAKGEYIVYLDIDDMYTKDYLKTMKEAMTDKDWYWFDDLSWNKHTGRFDLHRCNIDVQGACGTSNICHKASMNARWVDSSTYLHDWIFISLLKAISQNYCKLDVVGYGICHVPNLLDV